MTLVLRPVGRGNWAPVTLAGRHLSPMVKLGDRIVIGGTTYRVSEIRP